MIVKPPISFPRYQVDHPLAKGLVFATMPGGSHKQELVTGNNAINFVLNSANNLDGVTPHGKSFESTGATNDSGCFWSSGEGLYKITEKLTILIWGTIDAFSGVGNHKIVSVPVANGTWASPFLYFSMGRTTDDAAIHEYNSGGTVRSSTATGTNFFQEDGTFHQYGMSRNGTTIDWWKDGSLFENVSTFDGDCEFTTKEDVTCFNRSSSNNGEGVNGRIALAMIWDRPLVASEIAQLNIDPYEIFRLGSTVLKVPSISGNIIGQGELRRRLLRLYLRETGALIASTYSDPITGDYAFEGLDPTKEYFVVELDE